MGAKYGEEMNCIVKEEACGVLGTQLPLVNTLTGDCSTHLAPPAVSWNSTADTMLLSSSTVPQFMQMVSPVASCCSSSVPPQLGHETIFVEFEFHPARKT